jgi:hypothetical protein
MHRLPRVDAIRKVLALVDIEDGIFAHHRDQARCGVIVRALVADLQLLNEIDLGAVLALADVAAQLQGLLERQKARRAIASRLRHPQQDNIAAGVGPVAHGIAGGIRTGGCRPWLNPRGGAGF